MNRNKGAVMLLIMVILMIASTMILYSYTHSLFFMERDFLFAKYYERAVASALSCREVAAARLTTNFQYRTSEININSSIPKLKTTNIDCSYSVTTNSTFQNSPYTPSHNPKDIYIDINATGTVSVPKFIYPRAIKVGLKSIVLISYTGPTIITTSFY